MKVCAVADLHGNLPEIPACDLLLVAGDICPTSDHSPRPQARWLAGEFQYWMGRVPAERIVVVAGNHDLIFQDNLGLLPPWTRDLNGRIQYLQDNIGLTWFGDGLNDHLTIYGTPWQRPFNGWAFNLPEEQMARKWAAIPDDTDIRVLHGPPRGYGDRTVDGMDAGSQSLRERIGQIKPKLTVFGHVHEARGRWDEDFGTLANVSLVDEHYRPVHKPMLFEI